MSVPTYFWFSVCCGLKTDSSRIDSRVEHSDDYTWAKHQIILGNRLYEINAKKILIISNHLFRQHFGSWIGSPLPVSPPWAAARPMRRPAHAPARGTTQPLNPTFTRATERMTNNNIQFSTVFVSGLTTTIPCFSTVNIYRTTVTSFTSLN